MEPVDRRDWLMRRVAAALRGRKETAMAAPPAPPHVPAGGETLVARFRGLFEAQGGDFLSGPALEPLLPALGETLRLSGVAALLFPNDDPAAREAAEALVPFGPFTLASPSDLRRTSSPPAAGIQSAEYAVAETGSLVQTSREGKTLLPGLLAEVHVALLSPAAFVDRIDECLAALSADPPRNISFITGPSRTADIEQTLTIGAHGPRKVIAVLIERSRARPTTPSPEGR